MKLEKSKKVIKKYACIYIKELNNRTGRSRDIVLKLEKLAGKKFCNINPFVNFFNSFLLEKKPVEGFCLDLEKVYGDLHWEVLDKKLPFLPCGSSEVLFCEEGEEVVFDEHSVAHRFVDNVVGERVKVGADSKNIFVCFCLGEGSDVDVCHLSSEFAKEGEGLFGGVWSVFEFGPVEIDFETLRLDEKLDAVSDLKKLSSGEVRGSKGLKKRKEESLGLVNENSLLFELNRLVTGCLGIEDRVILTKSPNLNFGHFSTNIAFEVSKAEGRKVVEVAEELVVKLSNETCVKNVFEKIEVAKNGFVNFFVSDVFLINYALKTPFDFSCNVGKGRVVLIESPSANPNKPMHVGHLRNVFLAKSLGAVFEKVGFKVHYDNLVNDKGLPICKAMWALKKFEAVSPEEEGLKSDHFVEKYYVLGSKKFKESKEVEEEVREILRKLESGESETKSLWKKMISWAVEGQKETMSRLGEEMGHLWFESEIYGAGKAMILENIDGEKIVKTSDGAVIGKIEKEYGVPDVVLLKSDGTSLYHTQDLALTKLKVEKFSPWKAIWVVGNEQVVHFQRLFSLIDSLGLLPIDNLYHLAYGYVFAKDGKKMSSRSGEALSGDELLDIVEKATKNEDVALGALKYAFLSSDTFKDMKFDMEQAINFTGRSGPYIMYAYARACNILKEVEGFDENIDISKMTVLNRQILLKCLDYPNVLMACANNYSPSILSEYMYDLAKLFSQMYENEKVLESSDSEKNLRIFVLTLVREILKDSLTLFRIKPLEKM